ncbi:CBS domain-containing protein [Bacillus sp. 1P06AnD]|uniref:CBS domain-containing protein n=1 Tax=Bacillus sp. 1P06AnD TaxID=3132208 RepID=UPI0039A07F3B
MSTVRDAMNSPLHSCTVLDNVYEAALMMKENNIGAVPIFEENKLIGILTDRDIALRGVGSKHPGSTKITDLMSEHVITVSPEQSLTEAAAIMASHQIRRLPVMDGDTCIGMVSLGDLSRFKEGLDCVGKALKSITEK